MSRKRAPGPYSYDDDEDYVPSKGIKYSEREDVLPVKEKKHTLDSDEEDDDNDGGNDEDEEGPGGKNYDVLRDEDIDGQEEGTVDFEGETKIMPFNMKEEMEEGHFDGDGFYHFKKNTEQIKDAWLDDIDWVKVKHQEETVNKYGSDVESDGGSDNELPSGKGMSDSLQQNYTEIIGLLQPGETLAKALKRLGGNKNKKISSAQRWKLKKTGKLDNEGGDNNMKDFLRLTELANNIMETGNMDIYQETYEMINLKLERAKAPAPAPAMDMFADDTGQKDSDNKNGDAEDDIFQEKSLEVKWELRWEDKEDAEIHGPFTSEKMLQWQESGYFSKGGFVRKTTDPGQTWYSTRRIDFDLYV